MPDPLISVSIVTYNSRDDIAACLEALLAADYPRLDIVVVDNASADGTADLVAQRFPDVRLMRSSANLGFGGGANLGFAHSSGGILLVLNPDVRLHPAALRSFCAAFAADDSLGIAGAKLLYPDGRTVQHAGGIVEYPLATTRHRGYGEADSGQYDEPHDVPFVTGAALALRRAVLQSTGGFDAGFYPVYYEDTDLCFRARSAGWRVACVPAASGWHRTSVTLDPASQTYFRFYHANRLRFVLKHYTTAQIVNDFLPAESQRLCSAMPAADRLASHAAYHDLGETNMADQPLQPTELDRLLSELEQRWLIREQPFTSRLPLLGPLIVRLRSLWNSVSTRWYVQPILQQQVEFNAAAMRAVQALARAVQALARQAEAQEGAIAASRAVRGQRLLEVDERVSNLEQRLP